MRAGYWFVQPYRIGGKVETEQPCADCEETAAKVEAFKSMNTDPARELRVHVPAQATDDESDRIRALRVEPI
jgi:hypothetical protein